MTDNEKLIADARAIMPGVALNALELIPDGEHRRGCIISDGATTKDGITAAFRLLYELADALEAVESRTPTDDEREALIDALLDELGWEWDEVPEEHIPSSRSILGDMADRVLAVTAGFRRSEVPEPSAEDQGAAASCHLCVGAGGYEDPDGEWVECSCQRAEPQGEPSDVQELLEEADALIETWDRKGSWSPDSPVGLVMRLAAALRAAGGVR